MKADDNMPRKSIIQDNLIKSGPNLELNVFPVLVNQIVTDLHDQ